MSRREIRDAEVADLESLRALINTAYEVEAVFVSGPRIDIEELAERLSRGRFLITEQRRSIIGCVYLEVRGKTAYFGLLSVDPEHQGEGLGRRLVEAAEHRARALGCREMSLRVVNLRTELPPWYQRLGYRETGTTPFPDRHRQLKPCHFLEMAKPL